MEVTVKKRYYRESPTKVRPNLYMIKGKKSDKALDVLRLKNNKASRALYQLLLSGVAAAKEKEMDEDKLVIKIANCDQASRLKRHIFKARGRTARITKRLSHLSITLTDAYDEPVKETTNTADKKEIKKKSEAKVQETDAKQAKKPTPKKLPPKGRDLA